MGSESPVGLYANFSILTSNVEILFVKLPSATEGSKAKLFVDLESGEEHPITPIINVKAIIKYLKYFMIERIFLKLIQVKKK